MMLSTNVKNGYERTYQGTSIEAETPIHFQQIMTLIWTQQINLRKTKQHIIDPKLEFCIEWLNWEELILQQKYHFWPHMLHSQELQTVFHIYAYLKSRLALDPSYPEIDMRVSTKQMGQTYMGMSRRQYLTMPQSQEENKLFCDLLWTLIMKMIKSEEALEQDSASLEMWLA